jgi:hypothetical protein
MANSATQNSSDTVKTTGARKAGGGKRKVAKAGSSSKARSKAQHENSSSLYQQGRDALSGAYDTASKAGRSLPKLSGELHLRQRGQSLYTMMEERPLVLGAVGLGVGIVLATLLPSMSHSRSHR